MFKTKAEHLQEAAGVKNSKKDPSSNELADPQTFTDVIAMRSESQEGMRSEYFLKNL